MSDYYSILGITESATAPEIKQAYRKLAVKHHPDKNNGSKSSEEKFKQISEAYDHLSSKDKKKKYDDSRRVKKARTHVDGFDDFVKNEFRYGNGGRDRGFKSNPFNYQNRKKNSDNARSTQGKTHAPPPTVNHLSLTVPAEVSLVSTLAGEKITVNVSRRVIEYDGKSADGKIKYHIGTESKDISITLDTTKNYLQFKKTPSGYTAKIRVQKMGNEEMHQRHDIWDEEMLVPLTGDLFIDITLTVPDNIELIDGQIVQLVDLPLYKILSDDEKIEIETITGKKYEAKINQPESTNGLKFVLLKGGIISSSGELGDYTIKFNVLTPNISKLKKKDRIELISLLKNI